MFGFNRRAKEGEVKRAEEQAVVHQPICMTPGLDAAVHSTTNGTFSSMHAVFSSGIENRRAKARAYLAEVQMGKRASPETPTEKITAAREFIQNSTVDSAAICVWRTTIHYHAWCKRETWPKWNDIGVSEVMEQSDSFPCSTGFRWGNRAWLFTLENSGPSYSGDKDLGRFRVTVDGELVMELAVANGYSELDEWHETDICALTVGPWVGALIEMWAELELAEQRRRAETKTARLEEQASRIKLS